MSENPWGELAKEVENEEVVEEEQQEQQPTSLFVDINDLKKRRGLKMLVYGLPGTGKTTFCLSAETPIAMVDTENSASIFANKVKNKGDVKILSVFEYDDKKMEMDSIKMLKMIESGVLPITQSNEFRTIVIDTVSSVWKYLQDWLRWEVVRTGGKINRMGVPANRRDWAKANSKYEGLMMALLNSNANVILTGQSHPVYNEQGNMTGEYKPSVQKTTPYWVDVVVELFNEVKGDGTTRYFGVIKKCRYPTKESVVGKVIENPTFDKIKKLVFGGNENEV